MVKRPLQFKDAMLKGLRSVPKPRNQNRLARAYNLKPTREGLKGWAEIPQLFEQARVSFPFPQLYVGREYIYILDATQISTYDPATGIETVLDNTITEGGSWHFVDHGVFFKATNGVNVVYRENSNFDYSNPGAVIVVDKPVIGTICEHRGRIISGGFVSNSVWSNTWAALFRSYRGRDEVPAIIQNMSYTLNKKFALWSNIGVSDMSFRWLIDPSDAFANGGLKLFHALSRNEWGMMEMPVSQGVLVVKEHELGFIVYGDDGVFLMKHHSITPSTYGRTKISSTGIAGRGAVAGDVNTHVYVNARGALCIIDKTGNVSSLGFEEFFKPLLTEDIEVTFYDDPDEPEFYISTRAHGYCLTTQGLGEQFQAITSVGSYGGPRFCISRNLSNKGAVLETSEYDGGVQANKTVRTMRVSTNQRDLVTGGSILGYDSGDPSIYTPLRLLNPQGNVMLGDTGTNFRFVVRTPTRDGLVIEQIDLEIEFLQKTFVRSAYGQEAQQ